MKKVILIYFVFHFSPLHSFLVSGINSIHKLYKPLAAVCIILISLTLFTFHSLIAQENKCQMLDLSGLAWIEGNLLLGVHDTKAAPELNDVPRISLITIPGAGLDHIICKPLNLKYPDGIGPASDLESACRIPGNEGFLLCESGQSWGGEKRIFFVRYQDHDIEIISYIDWPVQIANVEATEVCRVLDRLVFVYAERAEGQPSTYIRWAQISLDPLNIGPFQEILYKSKGPVGEGYRPVTAMDIDKEGNIYVASAYDPNVDVGPHESLIWKIGKVSADKDGLPVIKLKKSKLIGTMDGLKVESISIVETSYGIDQLFYGTDDESYGGIIRLLPEE